jgi:hypothetical protein
VEDGINSNDRKKRGILYLFMLRMEPISTTSKAWYSLLIHAEDGTNSNGSKEGGILYLLMLLDMYGDLFNFFWLFGTESRR